jgi:hypothetical protein
MKRDYNKCFAYSSSESGCVCVSYRQYVDGFIRFGHNGLFIYLGSKCRSKDLFIITGVDNI